MRKKILIFIIFIGLFTVFHPSAFAAEIYFSSPSETKLGEKLELVVNLNTDDVAINAVELVIQYDQNMLTFDGYSDDDTMIKLWIDPPHVREALSIVRAREEQVGKVYLSGIIPGGITGLYDPKKDDKLEAIPLVRLFFTPIKKGDVSFSFENSKVLKHDGLGTALPVTEISRNVYIKYVEGVEKVGDKLQDDIVTKNSLLLPSKDSIFWKILTLAFMLVVYKLVVQKLIKKTS